VPLGLAYIDYPRKRIGIGGYLELTGNESVDLDALRSFYANKTGKRPKHQGEIRFVHQSLFQHEPGVRCGADRALRCIGNGGFASRGAL